MCTVFVIDVEMRMILDPNVCYLFLSKCSLAVVVCGFFTFLNNILVMFVV